MKNRSSYPRLFPWAVLFLILLGGCSPGDQDAPVGRDDPAMPAKKHPGAKDREYRKRVIQFWEVYRKALMLQKAGHWPESAELFRQALELDPEHESALYFLGNALFEVGRYEEALNAWRHMARVNPGSARAHFQLGTVQACPEAGAPWNLDAAATEYRRVIELNPEQTGPQGRLAEIDLARGRLDAAAARFEKLLRSNPDDASAFYLLGFIRYRKGDRLEAENLLRRAAKSIQGQSPVGGVLGEGDSTAKLVTTFPQKRLFGKLWLDLQKRLKPESVGPKEAEAEYEKVNQAYEAILARGSE